MKRERSESSTSTLWVAKKRRLEKKRKPVEAIRWGVTLAERQKTKSQKQRREFHKTIDMGTHKSRKRVGHHSHGKKWTDDDGATDTKHGNRKRKILKGMARPSGQKPLKKSTKGQHVKVAGPNRERWPTKHGGKGNSVDTNKNPRKKQNRHKAKGPAWEPRGGLESKNLNEFEEGDVREKRMRGGGTTPDQQSQRRKGR